MNTPMKLSRKELLALYKKSSPQVKAGLRTELGEGFFLDDRSTQKVSEAPIKASRNTERKRKTIDWEMLFDFTQPLRMIGYACLAWIIFLATSCGAPKNLPPNTEVVKWKGKSMLVIITDSAGATYQPAYLKKRIF